MRDDDLRSACFAALDVLKANCGPDIPWAELRAGFNFRGRRVPFLNPAYGIYRSRDGQRGLAALSINTSFKPSPYLDETTTDGVLYAYQAGSIDNHFNTWLRQAAAQRVPLVYFIGTRSGWYRPEYPVWITHDDPVARRVLVSFGKMRGPYDEREPVLITDDIERSYVLRQVRQRVHQTQFRGAVLPAYRDRCSICQLKEVRLLDAAHIVDDAEEFGMPLVANGLSLCTIHHRAFDQNLIGISPERKVCVARQLREDEDGPMLELLKASHGATISIPSRTSFQPDPTRLAMRFERFQAAAT